MRATRKQRGFTLVEILLAMSLFLIGITALMGLFHFGGDMESTARAHGNLASAIETVVAEVRARAWSLDSTGQIIGIQSMSEQPVPGAPDYRYDLSVEAAGDDPDLRRATLRFYLTTPDRPSADVSFLLRRSVPLERRLEVQ